MELSQEQNAALDGVAEWYQRWQQRLRPETDVRQVFRLFGFAGVGKTTIAKEIAPRLGISVRYAAFTGKAALVLEKKGCEPASTIHGLIYVPANEKEGEISKLREQLADAEDDGNTSAIRRIRKQLENMLKPDFSLRPENPLAATGLLILDECSMVAEDLAMDLLSYNVPTLVLGDPGQLPPIKGTGYFTEARPDIMLKEIHRQALDNPIIKLATMMREGKTLPLGEYGSSRVIRKSDINPEIAVNVEQIICGSNKARRLLNQEMRDMKGFKGQFPVKGEKLICLRNNKLEKLLNGTIAIVAEDAVECSDERFLEIPFEGEIGTVRVHKLCFTKPEDLEIMDYSKRKFANEFDFGYAITCHKAQGSQYDSVLVYDDSFKWDAELHQKWGYTAITRAADRVTYAR